MVSVAAVTEMFNTHVNVDHKMLVPKVDTTINVASSISSEEEIAIKSTPSPTTTTTTFTPSIRSGSHTDIGPRRSNEDAHIHIDDLSKLLGNAYKGALPSSFYAVFDGHGGSEASAYVKQHAMRLFFDDADLLATIEADDVQVQDEMFVKQVERSHCKAFLRADQALADDTSIDEYCGTTALTVVILGRCLIVANAGDCRAVICKKGVAMQMSQDHRPSCLQEKKRVEDLGGFFEDGYLNGELAVTRALGDWHMKKSSPKFPLIAEPEVKQTVLNEDDEFMIIGCDGIWDVMSNQEAVALVRRQLRQHNDPQRSAKELIDQALRLHTCDNLTAIVVCFSNSYDAAASSQPMPPAQRQPWRPKFRRSAAISDGAPTM